MDIPIHKVVCPVCTGIALCNGIVEIAPIPLQQHDLTFHIERDYLSARMCCTRCLYMFDVELTNAVKVGA